MENLKAIEKLDALLAYFGRQTTTTQKQTLTEHFNTSFELINEILDRLIDDGFVKENISQMNMGQLGPSITYYTYTLTFDGRFFYENGGYKEQKRKEDLVKVLEEQKERITLRNEKLLVRGTWAAAIVGLLVLAWQVYSYFYPVAGNCNIFNLK